MSKLDAAATATAKMPNAPFFAQATVTALTTIGGLIEINQIWQELMRKLVFPSTPFTDRKSEIKFQHRLMTQQAMSLLMLVWKDSDHVTDGDIDAAGVVRLASPDKPINCHNLAQRLEPVSCDFDKMEKAIREIVKAAEAYGLITRDKVAGRSRPLVGTDRLHDLMLALDGEARPLCADIAASGAGGR